MTPRKKTCKRCEQCKPIAEFKKLPPAILARSKDGYSNNCATCRAELRAENKLAREAARDAAAPEPESAGAATPAADQPSMKVAMSLPIEVTYDGDDFAVTQVNGDQTSTIFLAPHALQQLWEFAVELAKKREKQQQEALAA